MEDDYSDSDSDDPRETASRYCEDCRVLTDALRDMEQQRREAEDQHYRNSPLSLGGIGPLSCEEDAHQAKLNKLLRRRDCALEVLLKHQSLEHRERS